MNDVSGFHHVGITVRSLSESLAFYRDLLGFEEVFSWNPQAPYIGVLVGYPEVDLKAAILRVPNSDTRLELLEYGGVAGEPIDSRNGNPGTAHIALFVTNLDAMYESLSKAGISAVSPPVTPTIGPNKGGRVVYMIDPDGVRVELIETSMSFDAYADSQGC
jgi:lactoylglutathione lyase